MSPVPDEDHDKHSDGEIEAPNFVIPAVIDNSDDEDDVGDGSLGYQLLPQGLEEEHDSGDSGLSEEEEDTSADSAATGLAPAGLYPHFPEGDLPSYLQVPDLPKQDKNELLWNQPRCVQGEVMDTGHATTIKNAMKGFEIPACSIPEWAKHISEDRWKEELLSRLNSAESSTNRPKESASSASQFAEMPPASMPHDVTPDSHPSSRTLQSSSGGPVDLGS